MLTSIAIRVRENSGKPMLELWPHGVADLIPLLHELPKPTNFALVNHSKIWGEGFHPPRWKARSGPLLALNRTELESLLANCDQPGVIDLKIIATGARHLDTPEALELLRTGNDFDLIKKAGDMILYVHDNCRTYLTFRSIGAARKYFRDRIDKTVQPKQQATFFKLLWEKLLIGKPHLIGWSPGLAAPHVQEVSEMDFSCENWGSFWKNWQPAVKFRAVK